jgi:hypothetical protein
MLNVKTMGARVLVLLAVAASSATIARGEVTPKNESEKRVRIAVDLSVEKIVEFSRDIERKKKESLAVELEMMGAGAGFIKNIIEDSIAEENEISAMSPEAKWFHGHRQSIVSSAKRLFYRLTSKSMTQRLKETNDIALEIENMTTSMTSSTTPEEIRNLGEEVYGTRRALIGLLAGLENLGHFDQSGLCRIEALANSISFGGSSGENEHCSAVLGEDGNALVEKMLKMAKNDWDARRSLIVAESDMLLDILDYSEYGVRHVLEQQTEEAAKKVYEKVQSNIFAEYFPIQTMRSHGFRYPWVSGYDCSSQEDCLGPKRMKTLGAKSLQRIAKAQTKMSYVQEHREGVAELIRGRLDIEDVCEAGDTGDRQQCIAMAALLMDTALGRNVPENMAWELYSYSTGGKGAGAGPVKSTESAEPMEPDEPDEPDEPMGLW